MSNVYSLSRIIKMVLKESEYSNDSESDEKKLASSF